MGRLGHLRNRPSSRFLAAEFQFCSRRQTGGRSVWASLDVGGSGWLCCERLSVAAAVLVSALVAASVRQPQPQPQFEFELELVWPVSRWFASGEPPPADAPIERNGPPALRSPGASSGRPRCRRRRRSMRSPRRSPTSSAQLQLQLPAPTSGPLGLRQPSERAGGRASQPASQPEPQPSEAAATCSCNHRRPFQSSCRRRAAEIAEGERRLLLRRRRQRTCCWLVCRLRSFLPLVALSVSVRVCERAPAGVCVFVWRSLAPPIHLLSLARSLARSHCLLLALRGRAKREQQAAGRASGAAAGGRAGRQAGWLAGKQATCLLPAPFFQSSPLLSSLPPSACLPASLPGARSLPPIESPVLSLPCCRSRRRCRRPLDSVSRRRRRHLKMGFD